MAKAPPISRQPGLAGRRIDGRPQPPGAPTIPEPAGLKAPRPAARRSQEQRRTDTQRRLCEAAVSLLCEVGYERLTTAQIAQRAQVSKGAQAYHYPTKDDMLVAAFSSLLDHWRARREAFVQSQGDQASVEEVLRYLWRDIFGRPDYLASIEMMLAARHHPALSERLRTVLATWTAPRDDIFRRLIPLDPAGHQLDTFMQMNFCLLRGLALYGGINDDPSLQQRVLALWSDMASAYVADHGRPDPQPFASPNPSRRSRK